jgi:hypothetical protein
MKPLHIGLLLVGAALAVGLAVKMTQQPPIPAAATAVQPPSMPAVVNASPAVANSPVPKPSPIPVAPQIARAAAPEPVYNEPPKPAIRKSKPILPAPVLSTKSTKVKPTQWAPARYVASAESRPAAPAVPVVQSTPPDSAPTVLPVVLKDKPPAPRQVTIQTGMTVPVRLDESISRTSAGDSFQASLVEPLVVDGLVIAERGARVTGRVRAAKFLELGLATLSTSDGQRVAVSSDPWTYGAAGMIAGGTVIRFRLTSKLTITEQQIAGR